MQCQNHPERKAKAKKLCGSCYNRSLYENDPDKKNAMLERHREAWALRYSARNSQSHARKQKNRTLRHRYGIDLELYQQMQVEQQNSCAICGKVGGDTRGTRLYVDHNHSTNKVRSLLCSGCNTSVGVFEKGVHYVVSVVKYLHKHSTDNTWNALARLELQLRNSKQ